MLEGIRLLDHHCPMQEVARKFASNYTCCISISFSFDFVCKGFKLYNWSLDSVSMSADEALHYMNEVRLVLGCKLKSSDLYCIIQ